MRLLYSFFIYIYYLAILIASLFNAKAKKWLLGRRNLFNDISPKLKNEKNIVWMHCASVGEFEQGRPLIEYLKVIHPEIKILLTFFSPSGYELRKNYSGADFVFYLPLDTSSNAKKFLEIVNPRLAIIVKYELWYNFFIQLHRNNIPYFLISANFRARQYFFKWYGYWFCRQLQNITCIFVQDVLSQQLLTSIGVERSVIAGDTRVDRVAEINKSRKVIAVAEKFSANSRVIVAGSTWPADEALLASFINQHIASNSGLKFIVAPHEIIPGAIDAFIKLVAGAGVVRYSEAAGSDLTTARVLIVDNVGMLSSLYAYGCMAYIGGGFGKGIHNILEAAVFGLPVIFGPNFTRFKEAVDLKEKGGAYSITDAKSLADKFLELLTSANTYTKAQKASLDYISENKGATVKIAAIIADYI